MTDLHQPPAPPPPPPAGRAAEPQATGSSPIRLGILGGLVALLAVRGGWAPLVVVLGVVVMIFLHELGHYLAARWGGMKVTEFFIGFGPKIWSFRRGETEYGLKVIPAGAYVKVIGMNNLDDVEPGDEDRTYRQASYPRRMAVAVAGSAMHFAQALILLFLLYGFVGVPGGSLTEDREWEVGEILPDSAADQAGLQPEDRVLALDGVAYDTFTDFATEVSTRPGDTVTLSVDRGGQRLEVPVTIGVAEFDPTRGQLGVRRDLVTTTVGPVAAVGTAVTDFGEQSWQTLSFIGGFFTPSGIADFAGTLADGGTPEPVPAEPSTPAAPGSGSESPDGDRIISILGAVRIGADLTEEGMIGFLLFFVGINITIGIFNLLPVLPLDGGHVVVATYERIRELRRPKGQRYLVDMAKLLPVVYAVFVVLVMLGVTTIYLDLIDPVSL